MVGFGIIRAQYDIIALLTTNWDSNNTSGITPVIERPIDESALDMNNNDYVLVKPEVEISNPLGIHADNSMSDVPVSIHCWTGRAGNAADEYLHMEEILNECGRIIKANPRLNGYAKFYPQKVHNADENARQVYHFVIDCLLEKMDP